MAQAKETLSAGSSRHPWLWLAAAVMLALALRLMQAPQVMWGEGLVPLSPDAHYHMRLAMSFLNLDVSLPMFDPLLNYPKGALIYWPPGFDLLLALVGLPVKLVGGGPQAISLAFGFLMPALFLVGMWWFYRAAAQVTDRDWAAVAAVFLMATSFSLSDISLLGRVDHHILEMTGWCLFLFLLVQLANRPERSARTGRVLGVLLGFALFLWNGAIVVIALVHGWLLIWAMTAEDKDAALHSWRTVSRWSLPPALTSVLVTGTAWVAPLSPVYLSFFHLAACAAPLVVAEGWLLLRRRPERRAVLLLTVGFLGAAFVAVLAWSGPALWGILVSRDLNAATVMESVGLVRAYQLALLFQPLLLLSVPVLIMTVIEGWRERDGMGLPLAGGLGVALGLSLFQVRFVTLLEPVTALGVARVVGRWMGAPRRRSWLTVAVLGVMTLVSAGYTGWVGWTRNREFPIMKAITPVMRWMAAHVPPDGATISPVWSYGHYVACMAKRPVVSCAFGGTPAFERGITASLLTGFAGTEDGLTKIMDDVGARFLLLPDLRAFREELRTAWVRAGYDPLPAGRHYAVDRLFEWNNGHTESMKDGAVGSEQFRLLYNSPFGMDGGSAFRLFERVSGAVVSGTVPSPDGHYLATVVLVPGHGTPVLWRHPVTPDGDGRFRLTCPYATGMNGDVKAISPLEVWDMDTRTVILRGDIRDSDLSGKTVVTLKPVLPNAGGRE